MARRLRIKPYGEVRLRHFTASNTRKGGGGEIDFIAYSPKGILWTDDLNKNQIVCFHATPESLWYLPLPVGFPEFANHTQQVSMWNRYCVNGSAQLPDGSFTRTWPNGSAVLRCWQEVLHYDAFYTDVNVGSDTATGGYVMAKRNSSKTCDSFLDNNSTTCTKLGGDKCLQDVMDKFLLTLPPISRPRKKEVNKLAIGLPVGLGGAAVIAAVIMTALWLAARRRRAAADDAAAAAAAKLGSPAGGGAADVESGAGLKGRESSSSDSREGISDEHAAPAATAGAATAARRHGSGAHSQEPGTAGSFGYATGADMGHCLGAGGNSGAGGGSGGAVVEGVLDDGSTVTISVGPALGQGSFGVVFKGLWQDKPVAVKVIMCDRACGEQVSNEVRLMTSDLVRHPNLLRAYAALTKTRVMNRQAQAGQSLEMALQTLSSAARSRSGTDQPPAASLLSVAALNSAGAASRESAGRAAELAETWIVSEYCDLGALAPYVHGPAKRFMAGGPGGRRPRLAPVLGVLRDIAAGMAHLHSLNVVHGDLKLANVLLCSGGGGGGDDGSGGGGSGGGAAAGPPVEQASVDGGGGGAGASGCDGQLSASLAPLPAELVAKVADFGLSRWLKEGQTHHSTKTVGTVTHMPPELLRSGKLTLSGDVYSFGIMMWELLTGSVPYKGLMYGEVVERVVASHRRPEFPPHTPLAYRSLAERCWAGDAAERPTFAAVLAELESMLAAAAELQAESDAVQLPSRQASAGASAAGSAAGSRNAAAVAAAAAAVSGGGDVKGAVGSVGSTPGGPSTPPGTAGPPPSAVTAAEAEEALAAVRGREGL